MPNDEITNQLDTIIALMKMAHRESLEAVRAELLADEVSAALLGATGATAVGAGHLKQQVVKATKQSESTVKRRIAELVEMGALVKEGGGAHVTYRSTGLIQP